MLGFLGSPQAKENKRKADTNGHVWMKEFGFGEVCQRCRASKTFGGAAFKCKPLKNTRRNRR